MLPQCVEWWRQTDNQATTAISYCPSIAFLLVQWYCPNARWNRYQEDLNSWPPWRTGGDHQDALVLRGFGYPAGPEIQLPLPEWSNWRGSESSILETDVYVWCCALPVVHARNEWMNVQTNIESDSCHAHLLTLTTSTPFVSFSTLFHSNRLCPTLCFHSCTDWIVQCFTSPPISHMGDGFYRSKRPNQQYQSTEGNATMDKSNNENNKIHICTDNNRDEKG